MNDRSTKGRPPATAIYDARAIALSSESLDVLHPFLEKLPRAPFDFALSDANAVRYLLCIYVMGSVRAAREVCGAFQLAWFSGQFLAASMLIRMLIELWGAIVYAEKKVLRKVEAGEPIAGNEKMVKLLFGSKSGVRLNPAIPIVEPPVNVMEFVRAADGVVPGTETDYGFLCDAAHPSYLQNSALLFAGARYNNWSNETFATETYKTLDRTLRIGATALEGIEKAAVHVFTRCVPPILEDAQTAKQNPAQSE